MGSAIDAFAGARQSSPSAQSGSAIDAFAQYEANNHWTAPKPKATAQKTAPAAKPKKQSTGSSILRFAKGFASAATTGEQKLAQGVARTLPGGSKDLDAQQKSATADQQAGKTYANLFKAGKISKAQYQKATKQVAGNANKTSTELKKTEKAMPTKAQIGLGAASTAADILTAGTYGAATKGAKAGQVLKGAKIARNERAAQSAEYLAKRKTTSKAGKTLITARNTAKDVVPTVAGSAVAGGLNAAAGGGDKKQIAENAAFGAILPVGLKVAGEGVRLGANKAAEKLPYGTKKAATKTLDNAKTHTLLEAGHNYTPSNPKVKALVDARTKQAEAIAAPAKAAEAEQASAAKAAEDTKVQTQKVDRQIELIKAKGKDSETGLSNVDKTKLTHLQEDKTQLAKNASESPTTPAATTTGKVATESTSANPQQVAKSTGSVSSKGSIAPEATPIIKAYGKEIELSEKNGYKATDTPNGKIYSKVQRTGRNNKDSQLSMNYYDAQGNKLTHEQAQAAQVAAPSSIAEPVASEPKLSNRKQTEVKATGPEPTVVPIKEAETKTPEIGQSRLAASTEQKAIDKKLTEGFAGKPEYAKVNVQDQSKAALELHKTDPERAVRVALGQELPPEHLLPESVYIAVENHALKTNDIELLRKLATESSVSSEATGMGQRIRMLAERDPDSAVTAMRKVAEARKAALERKTGKTVEKATSSEIRAIRAAKPKVTKQSFNEFIDSIRC